MSTRVRRWMYMLAVVALLVGALALGACNGDITTSTTEAETITTEMETTTTEAETTSTEIETTTTEAETTTTTAS